MEYSRYQHILVHTQFSSEALQPIWNVSYMCYVQNIMHKLSIFLCCCSAIVVVWFVVVMIVGIVAAEMALQPGRRAMGLQEEALAQSIATRNHAELAEVSVTAADGAMLRGWSIRPLHGNGDAVILLHGHTDNRAGMLGNADLLLRHGYAVLLPDARAHGASGGTMATYGVKESDDVRRWFDWIKLTESPHCIDGLGESMGAALLLQSLRIASGFCAVVAESPFASFREAAYDRLGEKLNAGAWAGRTLLRPAVEAGLLEARLRYGVDLDEASPMNTVAASKVPVLLIHGLKDTNLPSRHSEMIVARSSSRMPKVILWEPAKAGHCGGAGAEPAEFERRVIGWFESHD
jgi:dipeptidyl aminopeptidase/acylaminoacyl peptidase